MALIRRATWSVPFITAATGAPAPAVSVVVVVPRGSAGGTSLLRLHLIWCWCEMVTKMNISNVSQSGNIVSFSLTSFSVLTACLWVDSQMGEGGKPKQTAFKSNLGQYYTYSWSRVLIIQDLTLQPFEWVQVSLIKRVLQKNSSQL